MRTCGEIRPPERPRARAAGRVSARSRRTPRASARAARCHRAAPRAMRPAPSRRERRFLPRVHPLRGDSRKVRMAGTALGPARHVTRHAEAAPRPLGSRSLPPESAAARGPNDQWSTCAGLGLPWVMGSARSGSNANAGPRKIPRPRLGKGCRCRPSTALPNPFACSSPRSRLSPSRRSRPQAPPSRAPCSQAR